MANITLSEQAQGAFQALRDTLKQQHDESPNETGYMICMTLVVIVEELLKSMETNTIVTFEQLQALQKQLPNYVPPTLTSGG